MLRTSIPHFFRRTGWALCGQPSYRRANARALLARLLDRGLIPRPRRRLHIRPWLQWEQAALARIYDQNVEQSRRLIACAYGPLERTARLLAMAVEPPRATIRSTWRWKGRSSWNWARSARAIVGYAVTRGEQIVELMTAPDRPRAAAELLARCCGDAIEHDRHCVLLHAPPACPLFEIFDEAGGCGPPRTPDHGEVYMMRLLDPLKLLRRLCGEFDRRAAEARLPRPLDLGLLVEGQKYQLELGREGVGATSQRVGRSYLRLNVADFTRLVLGQLDWDAAMADGRLECSTALAREAGRALFPSLPLWRPPWDDMPALG